MTETDVPTICHALADTARRCPESVAIRDDEGAWTYRQLLAATAHAAAILRKRGIGRGERVVLRLGNHRTTVALLLGAMRNGSVAVPLNTGMKPFQLGAVLADAEPALVVGEGEDIATLTGLTTAPVLDAADLCSDLDPARPAVVSADELPDAGDLGLLIYTSGSTSTPKAVMSPHGPIVFAAEAIAEQLAYRGDDVVLTAIPLAFDYGLYQLFLCILAGAELHLADARFPMDVMRAINRDGAARPVSVVPIVPSLAELLITMGRRRPPLHSKVRIFTNTGAALTPPVIEGLRTVFTGAAVVPMFGTTECKRITILEPDGDRLRPGSCGRALRGTRVLIKDDDGTLLAPNQIGEITVQGPHLMAGYWRAPEATALRFRDDDNGVPTLHTGDYGHLDAEGYLYFQGRRDDLFKRRGVRMCVGEIEAAAVDVPGVRAAAVLTPAADRDLTLFAVTDLPARAVLDALAERLEHEKVPAECVVLDAIPLTPNGKTDRRTLADILTDTAALPLPV